MSKSRKTTPIVFSLILFQLVGITGCLRGKGAIVRSAFTKRHMTHEQDPIEQSTINRIAEPVATFVFDGKPFCVAGSNNYYLTYQSREMVNDVLDQAVALNMTVLRTWAFIDVGSFDGVVPHVDDIEEEKGTKNGVYFQYYDTESGEVRVNDGPNGLQRLDYLIHACRKRGLKLILVLTNNWQEMGGMDQYVVWYGAKHHHDFFTHEQIRNRFRAWIDTLVHRTNSIDGTTYRDDPAIFAWELGNELRCRNTEAFDSADGWDETTIVAWADEMATYIKSQDPNHMVGVGDEGFLNEPNGHWTRTPVDGVDHRALSRLTSIDFATFHLYPDNWQVGTEFGASWIRDHLAIAKAIGKPTILEEYNTKVKRDENRNIVEGWERRETALNEWHDIMREEGGSGTLIWMLAGIDDDDAHPVYPDHDGYHFWAGHPTAGLIKAHAKRFREEAAACKLARDLIKDIPNSPFVRVMHIEK